MNNRRNLTKFSANTPHTLADFVKYSLITDVPIKAHGLPANIEALTALTMAMKLLHRNDIQLQPLPGNMDYFVGHYEGDWSRNVTTVDGKHLFTITVGDRHADRFHFVLNFEPAVITLLQD